MVLDDKKKNHVLETDIQECVRFECSWKSSTYTGLALQDY